MSATTDKSSSSSSSAGDVVVDVTTPRKEKDVVTESSKKPGPSAPEEAKQANTKDAPVVKEESKKVKKVSDPPGEDTKKTISTKTNKSVPVPSESSSSDSSSSENVDTKKTVTKKIDTKKTVTKKVDSKKDIKKHASSSDSESSGSSSSEEVQRKTNEKVSSSSSSESSSSTEEEDTITLEKFIETRLKEEFIPSITKEILAAFVEVLEKEGAMAKLEKNKNKTAFEKALFNSKQTTANKGVKPKEASPYKEKDIKLYMTDEFNMFYKEKGCVYYYSGKVKDGIVPHTFCGAKCCSESTLFCSEHIKSTAKYVKDLKEARKVKRDELYEKKKKDSVAFWKRHAKAHGFKVEPITTKAGGKTKNIKEEKSTYPKYKHSDKERYYDKETGAILRFEDGKYTVVGCDEKNTGKSLEITVGIYDKMKDKKFEILEKVLSKKCKAVLVEREPEKKAKKSK